MFDWLRRIFQQTEEDKRQRFFETLDAMNADAGGGEPITMTKVVGNLKLRSGTLALADPQCLPSGMLEVPHLAANEVAISVSLRRYPSGAETPTAITLRLSHATAGGTRRKIGEVGIDSAKLVVAGKSDIQDHWTEVGKDRIGVISTAPDDAVLRTLTKQFKLKTVRVNPIRAEVVGSISEQLEKEIEAYLKTIPKYADFPFLHFRVETNNSFDRANHMEEPWSFMSVGNGPEPVMFVCETGRGDGCYDVQGEFAGEVAHVLTVAFIED
jgi:hypothetical protein